MDLSLTIPLNVPKKCILVAVTQRGRRRGRDYRWPFTSTIRCSEPGKPHHFTSRSPSANRLSRCPTHQQTRCRPITVVELYGLGLVTAPLPAPRILMRELPPIFEIEAYADAQGRPTKWHQARGRSVIQGRIRSCRSARDLRSSKRPGPCGSCCATPWTRSGGLHFVSVHGDAVFTLGSIGVEKAIKVMVGCNEVEAAG